MIAMGPALKSLSDGNLAQVSGRMAVACLAVTLARVAVNLESRSTAGTTYRMKDGGIVQLPE